MIGELVALADARLLRIASAAGFRKLLIHSDRASRGLSVQSLRPVPSLGLHLENRALLRFCAISSTRISRRWYGGRLETRSSRMLLTSRPVAGGRSSDVSTWTPDMPS